jgi:hypothetical protein
VQLFNASCRVYVVTGLTFSMRAGMIDPWFTEFELTAILILAFGYLFIRGKEEAWRISNLMLNDSLLLLIRYPNLSKHKDFRRRMCFCHDLFNLSDNLGMLI